MGLFYSPYKEFSGNDFRIVRRSKSEVLDELVPWFHTLIGDDDARGAP